MEQNPEDIPKEELLQLCMKLNKRMQAMETKGKELFKKKNSLQLERQKLLGLIESALLQTLQPTPSDSDLDFSIVESAWSQWDQKRREQILALEQKVSELSSAAGNTLVAPSSTSEVDLLGLNDSTESGPGVIHKSVSSDDAAAKAILEENKALQAKLIKADAEIDRLRNVENYLKEQCRTLENVIIEKTKNSDQLQKDLDAMRLASEERVVHFQLQLNQSKKAEEMKSLELQTMKLEVDKLTAKVMSLSNVKEEKETLLETNKEMIIAIQARLMEIEPENVQLREKVKDHERRYSALQILKAEQDKLINTAQTDVRTMIHERDSLYQQIKELDEARIKAEGQSMKIMSLNDEINQLKEDLEEKAAIIMRLRTEAQTSERNHAMRTAMLATCEAQVETLQKEILAKEETNKEVLERVTTVQVKLASVEARLEERTKEATVQIESLQQELEQERETHRTLLKAKEQNALEQLENTKKEFGRKAAMARQLLAEREEEVRVLSSKVREMQEEINSGAPTDRKLLEIAQAQSRRDVMHGVHRDTREVAFQQLQIKLASKDYELAQTQQSLQQLMQEVLELRKVKQREGINMDYLKNVILQYMVFPVASSERMALIPVIAMLLQFSTKEMQDINQAIRDPTFGARAVKEVKRIDSSASASSSAKMSNASSHGSGSSSSGRITSSSVSGNNNGSLSSSHGSGSLSSSSSSSMKTSNVSSNSNSNTTNSSTYGGKPPLGYSPPVVETTVRSSSTNLAANTASTATSTNGVQPSLSDQDLQEKLRRISGDILDLSTMSHEDIDSYLANMTPSTEEALSPQNTKSR